MRLVKPNKDTQLNPSVGLSDGLLAAWILNEGTGGIVTDAVGVNTGAVNGAPVWDEGGLLFAADTTDYVDCGNDDSLDLADGFTLVFRCKGNLSANMSPFSNTSTFGNTGWGVRVTSGGNIVFLKYGIGGINSGTAIITDAVWTTAAMTKDGANYEFFQNGISKATPTGAGDPSASTGNLHIGRRFDAAEPWDGSIDYIYIWDRILDDREIALVHSNPYIMFHENEFGFLTAAAAPAGRPLPGRLFSGPFSGPLGGVI